MHSPGSPAFGTPATSPATSSPLSVRRIGGQRTGHDHRAAGGRGPRRRPYPVARAQRRDAQERSPFRLGNGHGGGERQKAHPRPMVLGHRVWAVRRWGGHRERRDSRLVPGRPVDAFDGGNARRHGRHPGLSIGGHFAERLPHPCAPAGFLAHLLRRQAHDRSVVRRRHRRADRRARDAGVSVEIRSPGRRGVGGGVGGRHRLDHAGDDLHLRRDVAPGPPRPASPRSLLCPGRLHHRRLRHAVHLFRTRGYDGLAGRHRHRPMARGHSTAPPDGSPACFRWPREVGA